MNFITPIVFQHIIKSNMDVKLRRKNQLHHDDVNQGHWAAWSAQKRSGAPGALSFPGSNSN
jgi:hypothetical protein